MLQTFSLLYISIPCIVYVYLFAVWFNTHSFQIHQTLKVVQTLGKQSPDTHSFAAVYRSFPFNTDVNVRELNQSYVFWNCSNKTYLRSENRPYQYKLNIMKFEWSNYNTIFRKSFKYLRKIKYNLLFFSDIMISRKITWWKISFVNVNMLAIFK